MTDPSVELKTFISFSSTLCDGVNVHEHLIFLEQHWIFNTSHLSFVCDLGAGLKWTACIVKSACHVSMNQSKVKNQNLVLCR